MSRKALGEGVKSLFRRPLEAEREEAKKEEPKGEVEEIVEWVRRNPRVAFHNPVVAGLLELLSRRKPKFGKSKLVSEIVEEELKRRYPEEYEAVRKALEGNLSGKGYNGKA